VRPSVLEALDVDDVGVRAHVALEDLPAAREAIGAGGSDDGAVVPGPGIDLVERGHVRGDEAWEPLEDRSHEAAGVVLAVDLLEEVQHRRHAGHAGSLQRPSLLDGACTPGGVLLAAIFPGY
jgi:hypothetical protein